MTVSCPMYGQIWGRSAFSRTLEDVKALGVRWVAIHPYARIARDGTVSFTPPAETGYLPSAVDRARRAGVELFWKPHLAYWGSFDWRGAIDFGDDAAAWDRFFRTYRGFVLAHARFAAKAEVPLFAVGVELERMVRFEGRWRALIAEVRAIYPGRLTWAANWDGVEAVPFWDALDLIGVQAYFPLALPARDRLPTPEEIRAAWVSPLQRLGALAHRHGGRPVLFTEIGYPDAAHAAREPWRSPGMFDGSAPELRARLVEAAARLPTSVPFLAGMFWWKWMPGPGFPRGDFRMRDPRVQAALGQAWSASPDRTARRAAAPP